MNSRRAILFAFLTAGLAVQAAHASSLTTVPASPLIGPAQCAAGYPPPQCAYAPFDTADDLAYSGNGFAQPAVASDSLLGYSIHQPQFANDGNYGNGRSWISGSANDWVEVDLGRTVWLSDVLIGRDRLGFYDDRDPGQFLIQVSLGGAVWTTVFNSADYVFSGVVSGPQTLDANFTPVSTHWVRLVVENAGTDIDELQAYGPAVPEPATLALFGIGLAALAGVRKGRARR